MRSVRTYLALGAAILVTSTTAVVYAASEVRTGVRTGHADHGLDRQAWRWRVGDLTYSSRDWRTLDWSTDGRTAVSDGGYLFIEAKGAVTATFSGTFRGGPVDVRVRAGSRTLHPGRARLLPASGSTSLSFSFVGRVGHPVCGRHLRVQVRPATEQPVVVERADLAVLYKHWVASRNVGCA